MNSFHYCSSCLSTSLRPNGWFEKDGICLPCNSIDKDISINYNSRVNFLIKYITQIKENCLETFPHNKKYDCIVGVSGGKDSTRQALWVREKLGMRPLLVCITYPPRQSTELGKRNLENLISLGFDIVTYTPAPDTSRKLTLEGFKRFGNVSKATEMALHSEVPKVAINENIKLIFWGGNPATQTGDTATMGENMFDGSNLRNLNTLTDGGVGWIEKLNLPKSKFLTYLYPEYDWLKTNGIHTLYLGPAWDNWSMYDNSLFSVLYGLEINQKLPQTTGDYFRTSMLDEEFTNINMMIKYFKYGFGRATDIVNSMIRTKLIKRDRAIKIVEELDGVCSDEIIENFCDYVGINSGAFWNIVNGFVNKDIFKIQSGTRPKPMFKVGFGLI